jgi:glycosyltransferase involved in cell wall biosynthesis
VLELSVVVLAYRAQERTGDVVLPLYDLLEAEGISYELVVVANYWSGDDSTAAVAAALARERGTIRVVARPKRGDMGWDMRSGLAVARGRFLVVIDGDGQVPVEYALEAYRRLLTANAPIVKGRRDFREDGWVRAVVSLCFNALFRLLFRTRGLWDVNGRPKAITRQAYEQLELRTDDWFTDAELLLKARRLGLEVHEFPVRFLVNRARASFVGPATVWEFLSNMALTRLGLHPAFRRPPASAHPAGRRPADGMSTDVAAEEATQPLGPEAARSEVAASRTTP